MPAHSTAGFIALVAGALALHPRAQAPPAPAAGLSHVYITVNRHGVAVTGLSASNFEVRDNGKPVTLSGFSGAVEPVTLITLFDGSAMQGVGQTGMTDAVDALGAALLPPDWAHFGRAGLVPRPKTYGVNGEPLGQVWDSGEWAALDALDQTLAALAAEPKHRAVILFTGRPRPQSDPDPGWDAFSSNDHFGARVHPLPHLASPTASLPTEPDPPKATTKKAAVEADAARYRILVYAVAYEGRVYEADIKSVANDSGGTFYSLAAQAKLADAFVTIVNELHQQYRVEFTSAVRDGAAHKLEVKLKNVPGATARAPKTFIAPKAS